MIRALLNHCTLRWEKWVKLVGCATRLYARLAYNIRYHVYHPLSTSLHCIVVCSVCFVYSCFTTRVGFHVLAVAALRLLCAVPGCFHGSPGRCDVPLRPLAAACLCRRVLLVGWIDSGSSVCHLLSSSGLRSVPGVRCRLRRRRSLSGSAASDGGNRYL